ncbi:ferredoxin, mitochondrial [Guillardia theta CCMP2712]|uniref:2Fe-2S ferredoxin n=1 Tax=Guillardia theta (strain CCMP2712) TaxID=905079 RepID=L1J5A6_GUITC|nr:ferredoxin, mitochondrial [Guillardia theta CCMP2712]EKX43696.1 ferredoxin, mitochondrial [Guillardia theta CCMP2712]|mmetsp:Transcript_51930/g.161547  ORF Transcript_51930/g.161547 Transcript_51930/m.161547 type:complete len:196 (-) Transcript_51930:116-703(-)|eukprot:XP_005830676.1 ferredoxin, mitochondrial [Guillardia theta CCMP2712]
MSRIVYGLKSISSIRQFQSRMLSSVQGFHSRCWSASYGSSNLLKSSMLPRVCQSGWRWREQVRGHGHGHSHGEEDGPTVKVTFIYDKDGKSVTVDGKVGMNILRVAQAHEVELEGACECSLACSTCHVVLEDSLFNKLEEPSDDEADMLDLAFGLTETSRLGCQIILTEDMEGSVFRIPSATRNMYVDGHVPKPH